MRGGMPDGALHHISPISRLYLAYVSPGAQPDGALHGDVRDRLRLAGVRPRAHLPYTSVYLPYISPISRSCAIACTSTASAMARARTRRTCPSSLVVVGWLSYHLGTTAQDVYYLVTAAHDVPDLLH